MPEAAAPRRCLCVCYSIFSGPGAMPGPPLKAATTLPWLTMPHPLRTTFVYSREQPGYTWWLMRLKDAPGRKNLP